MKQPIKTKTGEDISPSTLPSVTGQAPSRVLRGDRPQRADGTSRRDRVYRFAVGVVFLILTLLASGDLLEINPFFAPLVTSPLFLFYHEAHDLLALMVALYAAHKLSPSVGLAAVAWFAVLHIPYAYVVLPMEGPELLRLAVLIVVALFGIRIIAIRSRLEARLNQLAVDLEAQRAAEHRHADELTVLFAIAAVGVEASNADALIGRAIQIVGDTLHPDYFGVGLVDEAAGVLRVCRSTRNIREERLTIPLGQGVLARVLATGKPRRIPDVSREPVYQAVNPEVRSEMCVPLQVGSRVIGLINVESKRLDAFSETDEHLMVIFAGQLATAIERVRLFQAEQRGREVAVALLDITQVASSSLELNQVLKQIAQRTAQACHANRCTILLLDETGELLEPIMSQFADGHADLEQWETFKATTADRVDVVPLFRDAIRGRRPTLLDDAARTDLIPLKWTQPFDIQKLLVVPLVSHDRAIGLMALDHTDASRAFSPDQIDLALTSGGQVASAITNARLYAQAERRSDQLRALREASRALTSDLRLETVLQTLVETARQLTRARYAALAVLGADGTSRRDGQRNVPEGVTQFHVSGVTEAERLRIGAPPQGKGLLGALLRESKPIRLTDLTRDPRSVGFPPHHPMMKTFMGVPIVARGQMLGSLYLTDKTDDQPFSQVDEDLAVGLAADAAIAIENARLFSQVQQLAITDELTGLHNRRQLLELAGREFERARRYGRPLSAIMLDLDHFKRVNDTFGHAVGDEVLRGVAARCRKNLRDIDVLARYGGEEFVAILPESDPTRARRAAERLCQCVGATPMVTSAGPVAVTISLGVAFLNEDCSDLGSLLNWADAAMYAAKAAGGNRVGER